MKLQKCPICNSRAAFFLNKAGYDLFKCVKCNLIFVFPKPSSKQLDELYSAANEYQVSKNKDLKTVSESNSYKKILDYLEVFEKGQILDIGCSNGEFLYFAKKRGFNVYGVELNPMTAKVAQKNGIAVFNGTLKNAKIKPGSYDYIFLGDVIEHVIDPGQLLFQCYKILKKEGLIIISTPNLDCFWANSTLNLYRIFKIPWSSVTPPYHLTQFSQNNLDLLAKKNNFKRISCWFGNPPSLTYELWFTQLPTRYIKHRNLTNFINYYFAYLLYAIFYLLNKLIAGFLGRDNGMVVVYKK